VSIPPCAEAPNGSGFVHDGSKAYDVSANNETGKFTLRAERLIVSDACVAEGVKWLGETDVKFAHAAQISGPLPLRLREDGFSQLLGAIVSQQLSVASADAIWRRLKEAELIAPVTIQNASDDDLRACGLSRQKIRYARSLCDADIDYIALRQASTQDVVKTLVEISGIGVWTAEIYAMFSLGRADVFAPGDLALQEAVRILFELDTRPSEKQLRKMAENWSPWRAVAARLLWAYYKHAKSREGIR